MECWALSFPIEISGISGAQHYSVSEQVKHSTPASGIFQFLLFQSCWVSKGEKKVSLQRKGSRSYPMLKTQRWNRN